MAKALVGQWGWTTANAMLPFTVSTGAFAITMIFAGRAQDKIGPRWVAMIGGTILGLALIASSFAQKPFPPALNASTQSVAAASAPAVGVNTIWQTPFVLVVAFGIMGGIGIGLGYSATTPPAIKWFPPSRKGLITGIVVAGVGLAAVYISPLTQWLLGPNGDQIPSTFLELGIGTIIVTAILAQFLRNPPPGHVAAPVLSAGGAKPPSPRNLDWPAMLSTRQFYQLWIMFSLAASPGLMVIANIAIIAKEQAAYKWGFVPIILLAIFNSVGRVVSGVVSDRLGRTNTMVLAFILQAINLFIFVHYNTPELIIFGAAFTGLCYGTIFTLFPAATADFYGLKNLGVNYGIVFTGFGVAGVIGPIVAGILHDHYKNYNISYMISAALLVVSAVLAFVTRPPRVPAEALELQKTAS